MHQPYGASPFSRFSKWTAHAAGHPNTFLIAVLIFNEPFSTVQAVAFALIWSALAIYSWSMFAGRKTAAAL